MKKIIFIATTPFAVNAFLSKHLIALAQHFKVLICVNLDAYEFSPTLRKYVDVIHVDFERKVSLFRDLKSLFQLLWIFLRVSPDAIHSITPKAGLLAMVAGFLGRVPCRCHTFTGQVWANRRGIARNILKEFDRVIVRFATKVFADSPSQCRFLEDQGVVRSGGISVLGLGSIAGVDLGRFRPDARLRHQVRTELDVAEDLCIFLFVGRLTRDKGVFDLVKAFSLGAATNPHVELWVVGPNEEGLLEQLQQAGQWCAGRIQWLGATPQPERYMASADVLVLPSYREGFGSVIIEAAACAIPSVAYRIDGVIDAVVEGYTGLLVEVGNIDALVAAMLKLSFDGELRQRLGKQAQERASKEFSSTAVTAEWVAFYEREL